MLQSDFCCVCVYACTYVAFEETASHSLAAAAPKLFPGAASHRYSFLLCMAEPRKETQSPKSQCSVRPDSYRHFNPRFKASVLPQVRVVPGLITWAGGKWAFWGWGRWIFQIVSILFSV